MIRESSWTVVPLRKYLKVYLHKSWFIFLHFMWKKYINHLNLFTFYIHAKKVKKSFWRITWFKIHQILFEFKLMNRIKQKIEAIAFWKHCHLQYYIYYYKCFFLNWKSLLLVLGETQCMDDKWCHSGCNSKIEKEKVYIFAIHKRK